VGVRKNGKELRDEIDGILARRHEEVTRILDAFGVPRLPVTPAPPRQATAVHATPSPAAEECCK
jgi:hypothetical protein